MSRLTQGLKFPVTGKIWHQTTSAQQRLDRFKDLGQRRRLGHFCRPLFLVSNDEKGESLLIYHLKFKHIFWLSAINAK